MGDFVKRSREAFDLAVENAGAEFAYRGVDALVNKAWMYFYVENFEKASEVLNSMFEIIEPQYLYTKERIPLRLEEHIPWYWVQLGKAYLLLGKISFKKYEIAHKSGDEQREAAELKYIGRYWTLSLAYNAQYSKDFRDVKSGRKEIYKCLYDRNSQEWDWVRDGIKSAKKEYVKTKEFNLFKEYVSEFWQ